MDQTTSNKTQMARRRDHDRPGDSEIDEWQDTKEGDERMGEERCR